MADGKDLRFRFLVSVLGADAVNGLKGTIKSAGDAAKAAQSDFNSLKNGLKTIAGAFVVQQAVGFVKNIVNAGDELLALSERTGIAVKDLAAFRTAAETADLPFESLVVSLKKFTSNLGSSGEESSKTGAALRALGVATRESNGVLRNSGSVIKDISDKFVKLRDGPEKAALAMKLFGKSGVDVIPFLNQGSEALTKFGLAIDDDFAARADQFNDTLSIMKIQLQNTLIVGLESVLPAMQDLLNIFSAVPSDKDAVVSTFDAIGEGIRVVTLAVKVLADGFITGLDTISEVAKQIGNDVAYFATNLVDSVQTTGQQLRAIATANFTQIGKLQDEFENRSRVREAAALEEREKMTNAFFARVNARASSLAEVTTKTLRNSLVFGDGPADEIKNRIARETAVLARAKGKSTTEGGDEEQDKKLKSELNSARALLEAGRDQIAIEKLKLESYRFSGAELARQIEIKKSDIDVTKATKNFTAEGAAAYRDSADAILEQKLALIEVEEQQKKTFSIGIAQGAREYLETIEDLAAQSKDAFTNAFRGMEDALVDFTKSGQLNFSKFADGVINDIIRIAVRQAVIAPLVGGIAGLFGGAAAGGYSGGFEGAGNVIASANGNVVTPEGALKLNKYANGGVANSPQVSIFGEGRTPEAYVPLPDGRSIPVTMQGGGGDVNVSVQVSVQRSGETSSVESDQATGKALGTLIASAVKSELINQKRPGGLLA